MWDTEKEHLKDGTGPVQILRKHKRVLKKIKLFYPALTEQISGQMLALVKPTHVTD